MFEIFVDNLVVSFLSNYTNHDKVDSLFTVSWISILGNECLSRESTAEHGMPHPRENKKTNVNLTTFCNAPIQNCVSRSGDESRDPSSFLVLSCYTYIFTLFFILF